MSTFDPAAFENTTVEQSSETHSTPVPEGEYTAIIDSVKVNSIKIKNGDRAGQEVPILRVIYHIEDDDGKLSSLLNREKVTVRQDIWLDTKGEGASMTLAFGPNQNVALGRLRDAVNLNKPGKPFNFKMLEGQGPVKITVTNTDDVERGTTYDNVTRVGKPE